MNKELMILIKEIIGVVYTKAKQIIKKQKKSQLSWKLKKNVASVLSLATVFYS